jgi:hypothetical protein
MKGLSADRMSSTISARLKLREGGRIRKLLEGEQQKQRDAGDQLFKGNHVDGDGLAFVLGSRPPLEVAHEINLGPPGLSGPRSQRAASP